MTLRPEVIRERLRKIREVVRNLRDLAEVSGVEFQTSVRHYWSAERGLQLAAESLFDVGAHILAGQFNDHPDDYEAIIERLGDFDVISEELEARLAGLGGFRNILVHGYLEVDRTEVHEMLEDRLEDFIDFADEIEVFLDELN